ncbi:hypothetical protein AVEN_213146-1 [Araneus ventricosus]|uniref:Uncharacterized protein n=1 Tax=Araneus ventricosus TaxID=182803 RepID=A0A4Y2LRZ5_ARAVE|nr:hypothetical protein AVEN_213146-1 [Araneus ventricosus]
MDGCESASELSKIISIGDAVDWIKTSWKKIGQEVITKCFVSCGISSREVERQLDLFDESTAEAELSKLAGLEYDSESFQHEAAVECFDVTVPIGRNAFWLTSLPKALIPSLMRNFLLRFVIVSKLNFQLKRLWGK